MRKFNKQFFKAIILIIITYIIVFGLILFLSNRLSSANDIKIEKLSHTEILYENYSVAKQELIDSVQMFINEKAPKSEMTGASFVHYCEKHNIDVFFAMAQCHIESNFATAGLGKRTNSAFNVGAYDNMGTRYMNRYEHPDMSIEPYIELLKKSYMNDNRNEYDLMKNYTSLSGHRYASDLRYEKILSGVYRRLDKRFGDTYNDYIRKRTEYHIAKL